MRSLDDIPYTQVRMRGLLALVGALLVLCAVAYWFVQTVRGSYYKRLAENNQYQEIRVPAPRGKLLERNGELVLVDNRPAFNLYIVPEKCPSTDEAIAELATSLELNSQELSRIEQRRRRLTSVQPLLIKEDIPFETVAFYEARAQTYPWMLIAVDHTRDYPFSSFAAHLVGRVSEITENQLQMEKYSEFQPGFMVGQSGLELQYQDILRGEDGSYRQVVDSVGRVVRVVARTPPAPGRDMVLTIDRDLQRKAEELFRDKAGALVAVDVNSGEILAVVSAPAFDPNLYTREFARLAGDERSPLLNRAISSKFSPGSVWKVLISIAGLQEGVITPDTILFCAGSVRLVNRFWSCNAAGGHGNVTLVQAITRSCNVFFYKVGHRLGIDKIALWAKRFGFGERTGIDLPFEVPGLVPSPEWKLRTQNTEWYPGETISVAIGQGPLEVTPVQMAVFTAAVANGGWLVKPHLVLGERDEGGELQRFPVPKRSHTGVSAENLGWVRRGLWGVVNNQGTATRARIPEISVAGKTGTAQVVKKRFGVTPEEMPEELRHHAWFVCFAPFEEPEIAVCVFVEHGGSASTSAVPLAAEFLKEYARTRGGRARGPGNTAE